MTTLIITVFLISGAASSLLTVLVRRFAPQVGLTDHPDAHRKLHEEAVPLGGGLAVFLATTMVIGGLSAIPNPWRAGLREDSRELLAMLAAGAVIVVVGLLDDRFSLRGRHKLLGQCLAVSLLAWGGLVIQRVSLLGYDLDLGILALPVTFFWLLGAVNAINLLDGMDGLATLLGIILAATVSLIAVLTGRMEVGCVALVFAGSLVGFLWFNFPPASIFLGDTGSMLIGMVIGDLAIRGTLKGAGTVLLAAPLVIWTIPIFDSATAILRRRLTGRSIYTTDRGHLHHRLLNRLGNSRRVLAVVTACCVLTSSAALISVFLSNDLVALLVAAGLVAVCIATGLFGQAEFLLLAKRVRRSAGSFVSLNRNGQHSAVHSVVRLQGSAHWEKVWLALVECAEKLSVRQIELDVNMPMLHEGYSATWEKPCQRESGCSRGCWNVDIPLMVAMQSIGRFRASGCAEIASNRNDIEYLLQILDAHESYLGSIIATSIAAQTANGNAKKNEKPHLPQHSVPR